ncbi:phosphatidylinositol 3,4,5-trisphosphate-dependent Rac exchanger 1 protein [Amblyraja radiata]|uniref:phosphatidylinositol 3,4,5-trisphosphate-dependent Rac exchanger 1 protein n=1 Tax=Amblyraja radiata TaxID=386614 RepID=UPI0014037826|nr:phosphatidylinositol 3,4,5-trisphosphate-dependent Rac exchanger 1 protein [Amblyraja radiata]
MDEESQLENGVENGKATDRQLRLRVCVMTEILKTEKDYVGSLKFLKSSFLHRNHQNDGGKSEKQITDEDLKILFSNIEEILDVHMLFLEALEGRLQPEPQPHHELGNIFLQFKDRFCVYQEYCSNHEKALRLLIELNKIPEVRAMLLNCMVLGGMRTTDIPLEGYLLNPIQRICKYPLLLKELLKRTPKKHNDNVAVEKALQAMKTVCTNINETKRQMEKLEALEHLQSSIEGWEGSNLTDICTELLQQGPLLKISAGNIQERVFFLFDNLLVYCKRKSRVSGKKPAKRTKSMNGAQYIFRGRISTEVMEVEHVEDGTADYHSNGYTVTNGWKIHNTAKNKWFVLMAKTADEKQKWLDAILKEREQRESLKLGMEHDAYIMISEKGEKLYHMMMNKKANLIKDRRRKLSIVPKCFFGNEFVSWLLEIGEISKAEEGVNLGQALLENGIIHHVSDKHHFKNELVLYRFRYDDGTYKPRSEMEDILSKGIRLYCRLHCLFTPVIKDRDHHLKTYKSVVPASKLIDWLLMQGDLQTREEAVTLGVGLCNNGFMHHVLEKSEFKDESQFFRFYPDEEMEGTNSKNKQLRNDFRLVENILVKSLLIFPEEDSYGFEIEEKNKTVVVKSVQSGSSAEVAGLQVGRKIYSINEDLVFLRPLLEVDAFLNQLYCSRRPLRVLVASKPKEIIKIPDAEGLCFQIRGAAPPFVHAVLKGSGAAAGGLLPGQCILKVNGGNVSKDSYTAVLEHFTSCKRNPHHLQRRGAGLWVYRTVDDVDEGTAETEAETNYLDSVSGLSLHDNLRDSSTNQTKILDHVCEIRQEADQRLSPDGTAPHISLTVDNVHLEHGVIYEYISTAGIKCHVKEKMLAPRGCFNLTAKILEAFAADDRQFITNYRGLITSRNSMIFKPQFEFRHLCEGKLDTIERRITKYSQFAQELKSKAWPSFKQASTKLHLLTGTDFCPANCHVNVMEVSCPKSTTSLGRSFSIRFGRKNSFLGLEQDQGILHPMSYTRHVTTTMAAPQWNCFIGEDGEGHRALDADEPSKPQNGVPIQKCAGLSNLLKPEDMEIQDSFFQLFNKLEISLKEMKQYVMQINDLLSSITGPAPSEGSEQNASELSLPPSMEDNDIDKAEHCGTKRVCFVVKEEEQNDSGHDTTSFRDSYSECNSNRDSVLSYTSDRSRSSYLGSDEMGSGDELPCDMRIPLHKQDKLHGCLEHLFNQVDSLDALLKGSVMVKAFEETNDINTEYNVQEFQQKVDRNIKCRSIIQTNVQEDPWNLPCSINALVDNVQEYVEDGKNQLLLAHLHCTDLELQLRRDVLFCQSLVAAICSFSEQLLAALNHRYNNNGEYEEESKEASKKWLEQIAVTGTLLNYQSLLSPTVKEERIMLEDTKVALSDLDYVTFHFRCLEHEYPVANNSVTYQVDGSRQALKVIFFLDSHDFATLPSKFQNGGSLKLHAVLFTQALEGPCCSDNVMAEEFQQQINLASLDKVKYYHRKVRAFYLERSNLPSDSSATAVKINRLLRPLNALEELQRLMELYINPKNAAAVTNVSGNASGVAVLPISSELCNRLGACQMVMCSTGIQRSTLSVSLEQAVILARSHGLLPRCIMQATDIMRKQGARVENSAKNLKAMDQMPQSVSRLYSLCQPPSDGDL